MHEFLKLLQQEAYFEEFLGKHLDLKTAIRAMPVLCPSANMLPVLYKGFVQQVNETVDNLNPRLTVFFSSKLVIPAIKGCLKSFVADCMGPTYSREVQDSFQVKLTVNHMRTHSGENVPRAIIDLKLTVPIEETERSEPLTHLLGRLEYRVRFQDGAMVIKGPKRDSEGDLYSFNCMPGELPHPPNAWGHAEVVWVEISKGV